MFLPFEQATRFEIPMRRFNHYSKRMQTYGVATIEVDASVISQAVVSGEFVDTGHIILDVLIEKYQDYEDLPVYLRCWNGELRLYWHYQRVWQGSSVREGWVDSPKNMHIKGVRILGKE